MGEITPWSTWYSPRKVRVRSRASTSIGSSTTQMIDRLRLWSAQMAQGVVSARFWHSPHSTVFRFTAVTASARARASSSGSRIM